MAGILACAAGLMLLRLAWARKQGSRGLIGAGWLLVALSIWLAGIAGGEPGIAIGVLVFTAFATVNVGYLLARAPGQPAQAGPAAPREPSASAATSDLVRNIWTAVLAGPLVATATALACGLCFRLFQYAEGHIADAIVFASMLGPILWGGLLSWMLMDPSLLRRTLGIFIVAALGALAFVLT